MAYQFTVALLIFLSVVGLGGALIAAGLARRQPVQARLRELELMGGGGTVDSGGGEASRILQSVGKAVTPKRPTRNLQEELARAGYFGASASAVYMGTKVVLLVVGLAGLGLLLTTTNISMPGRIFIVLSGSAGLSFIPNLVLVIRRGKRRKEVRSYMPDVIDLLEICVSTGMGLEMAWNAVTEEIRPVSAILTDEMSLVNLETHLGSSNADAMRHMAERTGVQELASLTAVLVQSERFGTSVSEALKTFATSMREMRSQRAEEAAEKMAVKLIFPMVLFIFPATLIVSAGPAVVQLHKALSARPVG